LTVYALNLDSEFMIKIIKYIKEKFAKLERISCYAMPMNILKKTPEKLKSVLSEKDIQRSIDTLIGTQKVRRIGPEILQNNESHTELPELPENLKPIIDNL